MISRTAGIFFMGLIQLKKPVVGHAKIPLIFFGGHIFFTPAIKKGE